MFLTAMIYSDSSTTFLLFILAHTHLYIAMMQELDSKEGLIKKREAHPEESGILLYVLATLDKCYTHVHV